MASRQAAPPGTFLTAFADAVEAPMAQAMTAAMDKAGQYLLAQGRREIAAAGFSRKWQSALRVERFPKGKDSINAAVFGWHKIPYAGVFEEGALIPGRPLLWLPLPSLPAGNGGRRIRPRDYRRKIGGTLYSATIKGKPYLGAYVRGTAARFEKSPSLAMLRRGRNPGGRGVVRFVPLYIGVSSVTVTSKFDLNAVLDRTAAYLPALVAKELAKEQG